MVKRYGNLYPRVVAFENLYRAYRKAAKGKRGQANVAGEVRFEPTGDEHARVTVRLRFEPLGRLSRLATGGLWRMVGHELAEDLRRFRDYAECHRPGD